MKIVAISDTHAQHKAVQLPKGDVLLFAGDGEFRSSVELISFNQWLAGLDFKEVIVIAGNHDFFCERHPGEIKGHLTNAVYLRDEQHVLSNKMKVWGSPMTRTFMDWAFMDSDENLERYHWSRIPQDTHILLVHGPAYGHLDTAAPGGDCLGSKTLTKAIGELKIPYVFFGHIHGSYGTKQVGKTTFINCSVLTEQYKLKNKPVVIEV